MATRPAEIVFSCGIAGNRRRDGFTVSLSDHECLILLIALQKIRSDVRLSMRRLMALSERYLIYAGCRRLQRAHRRICAMG
jgi:hypothetical protein